MKYKVANRVKIENCRLEFFQEQLKLAFSYALIDFKTLESYSTKLDDKFGVVFVDVIVKTDDKDLAEFLGNYIIRGALIRAGGHDGQHYYGKDIRFYLGNTIVSDDVNLRVGSDTV